MIGVPTLDYRLLNLIPAGETAFYLSSSTYKYKNLDDPFVERYQAGTFHGRPEAIFQWGGPRFEMKKVQHLHPIGNGQLLVLGSDSPTEARLLKLKGTQGSDDPTVEWNISLSARISRMDKQMAADSVGNIYLIGEASGKVDNKVLSTEWEGYFSKIDEGGELQWTKLLGEEHPRFPAAIFIDSFDNIWICGTTEQLITGMDPQPAMKAFVSKHDSEGELLWTDEYGTEDQWVSADCIRVDRMGNVFVLGNSRASLDKSTSNDGTVRGYIRKYIDDISAHVADSAAIEAFKSRRAIYDVLHGHATKELNSLLIDKAEKLMEGRGDGRISEADAQQLVQLAENDKDQLDSTGQKTLAFIYARYNLTAPAQTVILSALES